VAPRLTKTQSQVLSRVRSTVPVLPPRLAVLEIVVLLVIPALLEWLWPPFPDLTTFQPHPYWAAILLLSLQYGTVSGLLAAAVAVVATVLIGLPESDIGENHFAYLMRAWTQPVLWIAAALLLGHFRMRQIEQRNELTRIVDELDQRSSTLTAHATGLQTRCHDLERLLATRPKSATTGYVDAVAALWDAPPDHWVPQFDATLQAVFPGARAAMYTIKSGNARLVARSNAEGRAPVAVKPDSELMAAMTRGKVLSVTSGTDDTALQGIGVFALPMVLPEALAGSGLSFDTGFLLIESMPTAMINGNTTRRLTVLARTLSMSGSMSGSISGTPQRATTADVPITMVPAQAMGGAAPEQSVLRIPEIRSWRQLQWLPHALRPKSTTAEPLIEPVDRLKTTSSTSRPS
jgi:hypothetical protein